MLRSDELTVALRTNKRFFNEVFDDLGYIINEPLLRYRPRRKQELFLPATLGDLEPRLLEWYDASEGGYVYTLRVRTGIKSCHGNELTADDVKWSLDRALLIRRQGRFNLRIAPIGSERDITVEDKLTVRIRLEKPNVTFPHFLTSKYVPILDSVEMKRHSTSEDPWATAWGDANQAGFGAFMVEDYDRAGDVVVYRANPNYFDAGMPKLKRLTLRGITSPDERLRMLKQGEVDIAASLTAECYREWEQHSDQHVFQVPGHDPLMIQMNTQRAPFDQVKVRQALSYAVPYDRIVDDVWSGLCRPLRSPFADCCLGYTEEFFGYSTDLDRARKLLAEAGLPDGFRTSMLFYGALSPRIGETAAALRQSFERIGVELELLDVDERTMRVAGFAHDFDMILDPHIHMVADGYYNSICDYGDRKWGVENLNQYFNEDVFRLQRECLFARSEAERVAFVKESQRIILADAPQLFLISINSLVATSDKVRGLSWDANGRIYYQNVTKVQ